MTFVLGLIASSYPIFIQIQRVGHDIHKHQFGAQAINRIRCRDKSVGRENHPSPGSSLQSIAAISSVAVQEGVMSTL